MNGYGSPSLPSLYGNGGPQPLRMNDRRPEEQGGSSYAYRQQQQQNGGYFPSNAADGSRSRTQSFPASSPTFTSEQSPTLNSPLTPSSNKAGPSPVVPPSQVAPQRRTRETSSQESAAAALTKTIADGGVDLALAQRLLKEEQMAQSQAGPDRKVSCLECRASKVSFLAFVSLSPSLVAVVRKVLEGGQMYSRAALNAPKYEGAHQQLLTLGAIPTTRVWRQARRVSLSAWASNLSSKWSRGTHAQACQSAPFASIRGKRASLL